MSVDGPLEECWTGVLAATPEFGGTVVDECDSAPHGLDDDNTRRLLPHDHKEPRQAAHGARCRATRRMIKSSEVKKRARVQAVDGADMGDVKEREAVRRRGRSEEARAVRSSSLGPVVSPWVAPRRMELTAHTHSLTRNGKGGPSLSSVGKFSWFGFNQCIAHFT